MNATFRQLRLFLSFAEHLSVTAAARACHVTQPTASMQLRELADGIGMPLYEQVGKRLYLTAAGEALARTARTMLDEWTAFEQHIDAVKGVTRGRLRVSVVSTAKYFVPRLLGSFCAAFPEGGFCFQICNLGAPACREGYECKSVIRFNGDGPNDSSPVCYPKDIPN